MDDFHMSADEFRKHGHALVEWLAEYYEGVGERPIRPPCQPGEVRAKLSAAAPEAPEPFEEVLADLDRVVAPGLVHWQSPGWFGYFPANTSFPSILAEFAAAGLGQQGMLWSTSPAATEIENAVMDWLVELMGLPAAWKTTAQGGGVLQMSASDSTHTALVVAREVAVKRGAAPESLVAYASTQAHSSIEKGARIAGYRHVRALEVDERFALRPAALAAAIAEDLAAGRAPAFLNTSVGTTGTTAVDPVRAAGELAREHALWHHVDAAYAGSAMVLPELRALQDGLELVDSYTFNPHKWLFTNFDCSAFFVADRRPLLDALSILPPYLRNAASDSGEVIDYRDWHLPLGRRFRALKLWWVLRSYGAEGLRHHLREHLRLAQAFADRVDAHPQLERIAPVPFALVCFRHVAGDAETSALAEAINATGHSLVTPSRVNDQAFVRVSIGQTHTKSEHVDRLWSAIEAALG